MLMNEKVEKLISLIGFENIVKIKEDREEYTITVLVIKEYRGSSTNTALTDSLQRPVVLTDEELDYVRYKGDEVYVKL